MIVVFLLQYQKYLSHIEIHIDIIYIYTEILFPLLNHTIDLHSLIKHLVTMSAVFWRTNFFLKSFMSFVVAANKIFPIDTL